MSTAPFLTHPTTIGIIQEDVPSAHVCWHRAVRLHAFNYILPVELLLIDRQSLLTLE